MAAPGPAVAVEASGHSGTLEARSRQRRRQAAIVGGVVLLAGIAVAAYIVATHNPNGAFVRGTLSQAAAAACAGPVTPPVTTPDGLGGARALGRVLWLSPVFLGSAAPTQVWINAWQTTTVQRVVLRGWRCSDGRLLHFWFAPPGPSDYDSPAAMEAQLQEQADRASARLERGGGSLTAALRARALSQGLPCGTQPPTVGRPRAVTPCALDGLFMFSSPGKWVVQAQHGRKIVGTAVFDLHG
jgi:hypothetical protein